MHSVNVLTCSSLPPASCILIYICVEMNRLPSLFAAIQDAQPVLEKLDPPRRAAVVMALLALTLIGLFSVVFIMVGGHWVRRMARHRPGKGGATAADKRAEAMQLWKSLESVLPETKTDDTIHMNKLPGDTKVDG